MDESLRINPDSGKGARSAVGRLDVENDSADCSTHIVVRRHDVSAEFWNRTGVELNLTDISHLHWIRFWVYVHSKRS